MATMEVCGHRTVIRNKYLMSKRNTLRLETCLKDLIFETETSEVKSGEIFLLHTLDKVTKRIPVFARVYRTSFEHYAVFYQNKKFCRASTYINLKRCTVFPDENNPSQIKLTTDETDGNVVIFETMERSEGWLEAFQEKRHLSPKKGSLSPKLSPMIPRSPVMQTLHEADEEE